MARSVEWRAVVPAKDFETWLNSSKARIPSLNIRYGDLAQLVSIDHLDLPTGGADQPLFAVAPMTLLYHLDWSPQDG